MNEPKRSDWSSFLKMLLQDLLIAGVVAPSILVARGASWSALIILTSVALLLATLGAIVVDLAEAARATYTLNSQHSQQSDFRPLAPVAVLPGSWIQSPGARLLVATPWTMTSFLSQDRRPNRCLCWRHRRRPDPRIAD